MHNSARMLFRDFISLCLGNWSFELEIGSGTLLCAHYAHNICAAGPLWKFLCAHLSVWEQRPDLLIADNQCTVIVTNCTKIVSSENFIIIRIRYKYDKKDSFCLCSLWDGIENEINWRKIQLKLPWWPLTMMEQGAHHILYHFQPSVQTITKGGGIYILRKLIATTSLPQRKDYSVDNRKSVSQYSSWSHKRRHEKY